MWLLAGQHNWLLEAAGICVDAAVRDTIRQWKSNTRQTLAAFHHMQQCACSAPLLLHPSIYYYCMASLVESLVRWMRA